jgi:hypothetical protein
MASLVVALYAEAESAKAGCTPEQFKSGLALAERAVHDLTGIDFDEIGLTKDDYFRSWIRLKAPKSSARAIVELFPDRVVLHLVLPRDVHTYFNVEDLWRQHRSPK